MRNYKLCKGKSKLTQQIADNFTIKWDLPIKRTVGDILNKKEFHESDNEGSPSSKRHRSGLNADMEQCLYLWFANARSKNVPLTDEILKEKAKHFGDETGVTDKYSNGWLQLFKTRHGAFAPKDVFNIDETGLFFQMLPDRSLSTVEYTKGTKKKSKKAKDRITVALCCNSDGSEKMKLYVIGKTLKPRCFCDFNVNLYADYTANKKAWMTMVLFNDWLKSLNSKMKNQKRKVLLIMDNAPSHSVPNLSNVEIHFLPQPQPVISSHWMLVLSSVSRDIIVDNIYGTLSIVLTMMHPHSCH
jgi:hypothetical protein